MIIIAGRIEIEQILSLIKKLDVFQESGKIKSNFKLYHLKHAVAKDMAVMLKEVTEELLRLPEKMKNQSLKHKINPKLSIQEGKLTFRSVPTRPQILS